MRNGKTDLNAVAMAAANVSTMSSAEAFENLCRGIRRSALVYAQFTMMLQYLKTMTNNHPKYRLERADDL